VLAKQQVLGLADAAADLERRRGQAGSGVFDWRGEIDDKHARLARLQVCGEGEVLASGVTGRSR
jgi:hypothetical protein